MQMNSDGGDAESNRITSHMGHSVRPCHRTPPLVVKVIGKSASVVSMQQKVFPSFLIPLASSAAVVWKGGAQVCLAVSLK